MAYANYPRNYHDIEVSGEILGREGKKHHVLVGGARGEYEVYLISKAQKKHRHHVSNSGLTKQFDLIIPSGKNLTELVQGDKVTFVKGEKETELTYEHHNSISKRKRN